MLRDAKLRLDRLSPALKVAIVAVMAACGLFVAGLRGPGGSAPPGRRSGEARLHVHRDPCRPGAGGDSIDTTFLSENAASFIIMRPVAALARREFAGVAKMLEESRNVVPQGMKLACSSGRSQAFCRSGGPKGQREIIVFQFTKPFPCTEAERDRQGHKGKKMYVHVWRPFRRNHRGGPAIRRTHDPSRPLGGVDGCVYVEQAWSAPRVAAGQGVGGVPARSVRHGGRRGDGAAGDEEGRGPRPGRLMRAGIAPFSPVWENTTWLAAGARIGGRSPSTPPRGPATRVGGDGRARPSSAVKVLAQNAARTPARRSEAMPEPRRSRPCSRRWTWRRHSWPT